MNVYPVISHRYFMTEGRSPGEAPAHAALAQQATSSSTLATEVSPTDSQFRPQEPSPQVSGKSPWLGLHAMAGETLAQVLEVPRK